MKVATFQISNLPFQIEVEAGDKAAEILPVDPVASRTDLDRRFNPLYCDDLYGLLRKSEIRKIA